MNPTKYQKLPWHFNASEIFMFDLSQEEALVLPYYLPKGCSLVVKSKSKLKQQQNQINKQQSSFMNPHQSTLQQNSSLKLGFKQPIKQTLNFKQQQQKNSSKKGFKQETPDKLKPCLSILQQLRSYKHSWPFLEPVDAQALGIPIYYEIVKEPMDLLTVEHKLKSGQYKQPQDFYRDINLMIKNSYLFNQDNEEFLKLTGDFERYFWRIAGPQSKPINDKKLQRQKEKQREKIQKEKLKEQKLKQKQLEKQKEKQRKLLIQQQQQAQLALKLAKKKKKQLPKDILQAQNIPVQEKLQLANSIHCLPKQYIKGIRQIVFGDLKQQDQTQIKNTNEFDLQKIGYKKIRELQKYVRHKQAEMQTTKFSDQMVEKKQEVDLDEMQSEWSEDFLD